MEKLILIFFLLGASAVDAGEAGPKRGAELLVPFKQELQQALKSGLVNGHTEAIDACKLKAPAIADKLSVDGVSIGRSSDRLRNPLNVGPDWVAPILERYSSNRSNMHPISLSLENGRSGYAEPIIIKPLCLICHGDNIDPGIKARIDLLYPKDQATGYKVGDLRGVFWIEFDQ